MLGGLQALGEVLGKGHAALQRTGVGRRMHRGLYQLPTQASPMTIGLKVF